MLELLSATRTHLLKKIEIAKSPFAERFVLTSIDLLLEEAATPETRPHIDDARTAIRTVVVVWG